MDVISEKTTRFNRKAKAQFETAYKAAQTKAASGIDDEQQKTLICLMTEKIMTEKMAESKDLIKSLGATTENACGNMDKRPSDDDIAKVTEVFQRCLEEEIETHDELSRVVTKGQIGIIFMVCSESRTV